jgi:DNA helicase HerA-like ATPase
MLESFIAKAWNRLVTPQVKPAQSGLYVGAAIVDDRPAHGVYIPHGKRAEHICVEGKTGQGKSYLFRNFIRQDVASGRGSFWLTSMAT